MSYLYKKYNQLLVISTYWYLFHLFVVQIIRVSNNKGRSGVKAVDAPSIGRLEV